MRAWDVDKSGALDLGEFLTMYALSETFKIPEKGLDDEMRTYIKEAGSELNRMKERRAP